MTESKRSKLKSIREMKETRGWAVCAEVMQSEITQAAYQMADNSRMPVDEMHFRRGAIWAARKLLELPDAIAARLENELLLEDALAKAKSAKPQGQTNLT